MRCWRVLTVLGVAFAATHCAVSFHDYPVGALDASVAASGGASGNGGHAGSDASAGAGGTSGSGGGNAGGAGGSAATGGSGGASGADAGGCPAGLPGPGMVQVPAPSGGPGYCIDSTEVTNAQYRTFLAANVSTGNQPSYCSFNTAFTPPYGWPTTAPDNAPVINVNWCDAYAFCKWAGKRLCGRIGGGAVAYADGDDASKSQWFNACSRGGARAYPYGSTYDTSKCGTTTASAVNTLTACVGGYDGIYGMSGNVSEWEDDCETSDGQADRCRARGGNYASGPAYLRCDATSSTNTLRDYNSSYVGFRCCSP